MGHHKSPANAATRPNETLLWYITKLLPSVNTDTRPAEVSIRNVGLSCNHIILSALNNNVGIKPAIIKRQATNIKFFIGLSFDDEQAKIIIEPTMRAVLMVFHQMPNQLPTPTGE